jgi:hypothetical protein
MVAFMTWNEFFTWSWWTGIAGIAQVLSLFGIALAVYQLVAARRRITVSLICHFWANAINDATGQVGGFVVDIVNAGGELAVLVSIQVVGGAVLFIPQEPINAAIPAGGKQTIFVTSDKPRDVWLRFHWVTPQDRRFEYAAWRPMMNGDQTDVSRQWMDDNLRNRRRWWTAWYYDRRPTPVQRGSWAFGRIRSTFNQPRYERRLRRLTPQIERGPQWRFGLMDPGA